LAVDDVTGEELAELVQRTADAASAFIRGDMRRYVELVRHAPDYTLMPPFGGEPVHGFDGSDERLAAIARYFTGGAASLELVGSYASGDLVVLAGIERQHGEVGGLPDQPWSLRVTLVYRRAGPEWQLVHRHADPLVPALPLEWAAAIARDGLPPTAPRR
jgi:ketosteroid isomerase-like protein